MHSTIRFFVTVALSIGVSVAGLVTAFAEGTESKATDTANTSTVFPKWPERKVYQRPVRVPPPPGPYMSTALSGVTAGFPGTVNAQDVNSVRPVLDPATAWPESRPGLQNWQHPPQWGYPENGRFQLAPRERPGNSVPGRFDGRGIMPMLRPAYQRPVPQGQD